jgi:capsid portal protein
MIIKSKVVHCKKEKYDVYIGRPSKWGNPFTHKQDGKTLAKYVVEDRDAAVNAYKEWITNGEGKHLLDDLHELKGGKILGCWCKPQACHGDVLLELLNKLTL